MILFLFSTVFANPLQRCYPPGIDNETYCASIPVPVHPNKESQLDIHVMVIPAVQPKPLPDPLFFLAGGPGQAASEVAPMIAKVFQEIQPKVYYVFLC